MTYVVCNRTLNIERPRHCEFDGDIELDSGRFWSCPSCGARHQEPSDAGSDHA